MAKKKGQTPQELYFARKKREEEERDALLPPGFVNHGNTCFMNSVLQGLIATRSLSTLVAGQPIPDLPTVVARRSPLLMNGHRIGAEGDEQSWEQGMPLGDVFVDLMQKAWEAQMSRRRISLSPRLILTEIGRKFDQYLDFAQQDAHEFLRQLLDAMRMEELDIIKKRNPPPPQTSKRRRRGTLQPVSNSSPLPPHAQQPPLDPTMLPSSFVDLIFSGSLTSILVCQKCKKISQSYEAFDDLSLSIKPEDYARSKKRDKLRTLAKKLKMSALGVGGVGAGSKAEHVRELGETPRSSSVPPPRSALDEEKRHEVEVGIAMDGEDRRKSWDIVSAHQDDEADAEEDKLAELSTSSSNSNSDKDKDKDKEREKEKEKKSSSSDSWVKLGRRISMLGGGRPSSSSSSSSTNKAKSKSQERHGRTSGSRRASAEHRPIPIAAPTPQRPSISSQQSQSNTTQPPEIRLESAPLVDGASEAMAVIPPLPVSRSKSASPKPQPQPSPARTPPPLSRSPKPPKPSRAEAEYLASILADITPSSSANPFHLLNFKHHSHHSHTSQSSVTSSSSPMSHQEPDSPHVPEATGNSWARMAHILGIEECLRMFTAVEVLDGENMVGCRRCWKVANGTYADSTRNTGTTRMGMGSRTGSRASSRVRWNDGDGCVESSSSSSSSSDDDDDDASDDELKEEEQKGARGAQPPPPGRNGDLTLKILPHPHPLSNGVSISTPVLGTPHNFSLLERELSDVASVSSLPYGPKDPASTANSSMSDLVGTSHDRDGGEVGVPSISTTSPSSDAEAEDGSRTVRLPPGLGPGLGHTESETTDSLRTPRAGYRRRGKLNMNGVHRVGAESEGEGEESDASTASYASNRSAQSKSFLSPSVSRATSPSSSRRESPATLTTPLPPTTSPSDPKPKPRKPTRAEREKQVIPRPAYKRYLISKPPPVLVIHLKRFQQASSFPFSSSGGGLKKGLGSPISAFSGMSSGFKKIEDHVAFGEWLDLAPFLAPKREEFGLRPRSGFEKGAGSGGGGDGEGVTVEKEKEGKKHGKSKPKCMYRLYAVVVHLGNMLGGHYVIYTALPPSSSFTSTSPPPTSDSDATISQNDFENDNEKEKIPNGDGSLSPADPGPRMWAYISDTTVRLSSLEEVLKAKAYLCFYERIYDV